jgi:hypothetical protein
MTTKDFNQFLKPLGLTWDHNNAPITNGEDFAIAPGWFGITAELITDLISLGWDRVVFQVKEKNGQGRFYLGDNIFNGGDNHKLLERIKQWEKLTATTCCWCGGTDGVAMINAGLGGTVCNKCNVF